MSRIDVSSMRFLFEYNSYFRYKANGIIYLQEKGLEPAPIDLDI
ncbi:Uncharacterised protein [Chryseobacterium nakagawai]|nr:Uncharacterised protein [Chryseobacterium nakagawai]